MRRGLTLIEMLLAMALTLIMMAAVVTVFANVTSSVANRRATVEMSSQLRLVRNMLQTDLAGATCPAIPWQRTESNHGYLEVVEGPQSDYDPSIWLLDTNPEDGVPDAIAANQLDLNVSLLPSSNVMRLPGSQTDLTNAPTDGRALGDWDDILALTVRNENEPFVGRVPVLATNPGDPPPPFNSNAWAATEATSTLAEVIWFAVENPVEENRTFYFGEPGMRTVYRRALLIAPHLNYRFRVGNQVTGPGVVRVLPPNVQRSEADEALAGLVAFQERYDLSVRLEWDPLLDSPNGRWKIVANSLADLTKRENRYEHHGAVRNGSAVERRFPFAMASAGRDLSSGVDVQLQKDVEPLPVDALEPLDDRTAEGSSAGQGPGVFDNTGAVAFAVQNPGANYGVRPFAFVDGVPFPPTVRAIVDEDGNVVHLTGGLAPLSGARRGEDVVLSNMLAFDLRVYDPQAPLIAEIPDPSDQNYPGEVIEPSDPAWGQLVRRGSAGNPAANDYTPHIVARGAYVDPGYWTMHRVFSARNYQVAERIVGLSAGQGRVLFGGSPLAVMSNPRAQLAPHSDASTVNPYGDNFYDAYRTYGTWSWHYENNGVDEDGDQLADEGTNGFDNPGVYAQGAGQEIRNGVDDAGERETAPPYDAPLRGIQVTLRTYEPDSRSIREVTVKQTFVPK